MESEYFAALGRKEASAGLDLVQVSSRWAAECRWTKGRLVKGIADCSWGTGPLINSGTDGLVTVCTEVDVAVLSIHQSDRSKAEPSAVLELCRESMTGVGVH